MGTTPSLDELEARKRLARARMDLHRIEIAVHCHDITAPVLSVREGVVRVLSSPIARMAIIGGLGFFLLKGRRSFAGRSLRKVMGWTVALVVPRIRHLALRPLIKLFFHFLKPMILSRSEHRNRNWEHR